MIVNHVAFCSGSVTVTGVPSIDVEESNNSQPVVFSKVTEVKLVQYLKTEEPIVVTLFGIVIEVKLLQLANALSPIVVIVSGNTMLSTPDR